jgi:hypothetical protein
MLQISQTENPTFSATIDQIRLRRATNLPVEFQNVSSSGFHSEIQIGLFSRMTDSFLGDHPSRATGVQARSDVRWGSPSPAVSKIV